MLENSNLCFDDLMAYSSAISSIEVYDDISFCNTGKDCPVIANISDFMLALKEVSFSVVYSRKSDGIKLSVRSEKSMLDAGKIVAEELAMAAVTHRWQEDLCHVRAVTWMSNC
jgi:hypothetical protein